MNHKITENQLSYLIENNLITKMIIEPNLPIVIYYHSEKYNEDYPVEYVNLEDEQIFQFIKTYYT